MYCFSSPHECRVRYMHDIDFESLTFVDCAYIRLSSASLFCTHCYFIYSFVPHASYCFMMTLFVYQTRLFFDSVHNLHCEIHT